MKVKGLAESLTSAGGEVTDLQLITYVLDGLNSNYHVVLTTIRSRPSTSFDEMTDLLISGENLMKKYQNETQSQISAFLCLSSQRGYPLIGIGEQFPSFNQNHNQNYNQNYNGYQYQGYQSNYPQFNYP